VNATEIAGVILAAAAAAAAAVRLLDKLVELAGGRTKGAGEYSAQAEAHRAEILAELRQITANTYQVRIEIREVAHRVLTALGVPRGRHELPDDQPPAQEATQEGDEP
jgi:hypothetical protein